MPYAAPSIRQCGCAVSSGMRCSHMAARDAERKAAHDRKRPSSSARGYDAEWEALAKAFLAEPGNERCACGARATLVAHKVSIKRRPDLRLERTNWRPSCGRCNARDTARERREQRIDHHV